MSNHIVIGGTFFTDKTEFFNNDIFHKNKGQFHVEQVDWEEVYNGKRVNPRGDFGVIFGIKQWVRRMRKKRLKAKDSVSRICKFIDRSFGTKRPIGLVDDLELRSGKSISGRLHEELLSRFNCKFILVREYLKGQKYDKKIHPFSLSSINRMHLAKFVLDKGVDLYFRGDDSSDDRKRTIKAASRIKGINTALKVYSGGERSKDKIGPEKFFKQMADAKLCISLMGNGYSCFRYHEIPSVGSVLVTKDYPLITLNDYVDMESCIRFKNDGDLENKIREVLGSQSQVKDMTEKSKKHFLKYHTTEKRFAEFMEYVDG